MGSYTYQHRAKCVHVPFRDIDQFSTECIRKYEEALVKAQSEGIRIRGFMLCNPHNPTGRCYPKETIIEIMKFCQKYSLHLISDEVYAMSVYDVPDLSASKFTSVLAFDYSEYIDDEYLHLMYGMSKDMAAAGLRIGCFWTLNAELMTAMGNAAQFHRTGILDNNLAVAILEDKAWLDRFFEHSRTRLAENNKLCRRFLDDMGVKYMLGANAGFFLWVDLRPWLSMIGKVDPWEAEKALTERMAKKKVFLQGGLVQAAEEAGYFRLVFSQPSDYLEMGLERLREALQ